MYFCWYFKFSLTGISFFRKICSNWHDYWYDTRLIFVCVFVEISFTDVSVPHASSCLNHSISLSSYLFEKLNTHFLVLHNKLISILDTRRPIVELITEWDRNIM